MAVLRRHDLVRLTPAGWQQALAQHDDPLVQRSLAHWSTHDWPAVVATQGCDRALDDDVVLGVATPPAWGLRRITLRIAAAELRRGEIEFPRWNDGAREMPLADPLRSALDIGLAGHAGAVRVYGSFGWQQLTGLPYVTDGSDLDLLLEAIGAVQADEMVSALAAVNIARPRLDGELCFGAGSAVAWREWADWRSGRVDRVLVKRLCGACIVIDPGSVADESAAPTASADTRAA